MNEIYFLSILALIQYSSLSYKMAVAKH